CVPPAERLNRRSRVHISDWNNIARSYAFKILPAGFNLIKGGHVRHGASRTHVRQNHFLVVRAEDIRAFGHEMDPAKNDIFSIFTTGSPLGQLKRVSTNICELNDLISLIMMAKDH